jgi:hypothetical protein
LDQRRYSGKRTPVQKPDALAYKSRWVFPLDERGRGIQFFCRRELRFPTLLETIGYFTDD